MAAPSSDVDSRAAAALEMAGLPPGLDVALAGGGDTVTVAARPIEWTDIIFLALIWSWLTGWAGALVWGLTGGGLLSLVIARLACVAGVEALRVETNSLRQRLQIVVGPACLRLSWSRRFFPREVRIGYEAIQGVELRGADLVSELEELSDAVDAGRPSRPGGTRSVPVIIQKGRETRLAAHVTREEQVWLVRFLRAAVSEARHGGGGS